MIPSANTLALVLFVLAVQASPGEPPLTDAVEAAVPAVPALPSVHLAPIGELADVAAYVQAVVGRVDRLVRQAEEAADPMIRADLLLAAANRILAYQLEPACTREFLGITGKRAAADEDALRTALDRADALIGRAQTDLPVILDGDASSSGDLRQTKYHLETLQAFSAALRAYLLARNGADPGSNPPAAPDLPETASARRAALKLSVLLEDPNGQVAAAAAFWQACLRSRAQDVTRVMFLLPPALSNPPGKALPFAFFSKLLRCRLLASSGGHAGALALLAQIEERCDDWLLD